MFYLDIFDAARLHPALRHGDAAVMTSGPDGDCTALVAVGDTVVRSPVSSAARFAEARLFLALTAARFGATVETRPAPVTEGEAPSVWAELRIAPSPHRPLDRAFALAWGDGPTDDDALLALACKLSGGSRLMPCVVCGGPGVTFELRAFAVSEMWPVGARRICRAGWVCAVCRDGVRELVE